MLEKSRFFRAEYEGFMKKILKVTLSVALAFVCIFSFTACKKKVSSTTVDTSKVVSTNGTSTNGGVTVVYDGYLYFINGTKTVA